MQKYVGDVLLRDVCKFQKLVAHSGQWPKFLGGPKQKIIIAPPMNILKYLSSFFFFYLNLSLNFGDQYRPNRANGPMVTNIGQTEPTVQC